MGASSTAVTSSSNGVINVSALPFRSYAKSMAYVFYDDDVPLEKCLGAVDDVVGFFRSTISDSYNYLEKAKKVFVKEEQTERPVIGKAQFFDDSELSEAEPEPGDVDDVLYAFAKFDGLLSLLQERKYEALPNFKELCQKRLSLRKNLKYLEKGLEKIENVFKDPSLFQVLPEEGVAQEELQPLINRMGQIETELKPLVATLQNVKAIIQAWKGKLPSKTEAFVLRAITIGSSIATLTFGLMSIAGFITGTVIAFTVPMSLGSIFILLCTLSLETRNYLLGRKIEKWEVFQNTLKTFNKYNPANKEHKMYTVLGSAYKQTQAEIGKVQQNQTDQAKTLEQVQTELSNVEWAFKEYKRETNQKLDRLTNLLERVLAKKDGLEEANTVKVIETHA